MKKALLKAVKPENFIDRSGAKNTHGYLKRDQMLIIQGYLASGGGVHGAALYIGANPRSIFRRRKSSRVWREAMDDAYQYRIGRVQRALFERALSHDTIAAIFLLKNWDPEHFRDRREVHVTKGFEELLEESYADTDDKQPTSDAPAQAGSEPPSGVTH